MGKTLGQEPRPAQDTMQMNLAGRGEEHLGQSLLRIKH